MIKNIIFDFGGVISRKTKYNKLSKSLSQFTPEEKKIIKAKIKKYARLCRIAKISDNEYFQKIKEELGLNEPLNKIKQDFYSSQKVNKKIIHLIKELKKDYKVFLLTNHMKGWFAYQNKKYKLNKIFNGIITSFDAGIAKPNTSIYKKLLNKYKLSPKECLFIDNLQKNLNPAKKLGMRVILYKPRMNLEKEVKK